MMDFLRIVILYAYTIFVSFLLVVLIGLLYKTKTKKAIVRVSSRVLVYMYCLFSLVTVVASDHFMKLYDAEVVHSIICMIIYMVALLYAVAKNDPKAHKKVEFHLKKAK
jgi:hypothetical protein